VARVRPGGDAGQLTVLIIGLAAILVLLVTVVVDASKAFLVRRALSGAADGAAVAAANAVDESAVYAGAAAGNALPLDPGAARDAALGYAAEAGLAGQFAGFAVVAVSTDGTTATVTLAATVPMPLVNHMSPAYADGVPIQVTASARSPLGR
jgi:uncharacterized membrane protein